MLSLVTGCGCSSWRIYDNLNGTSTEETERRIERVLDGFSTAGECTNGHSFVRFLVMRMKKCLAST